MIIPHRPTESSMNKLEKSGYLFYLTGSRFFGNHKDYSDWDFFTKDTPEIRQQLVEWGFVEVPGGEYSCDPSCSKVFETVDSIAEKVVHVQLITPHYFDVKRWAQDILDRNKLLSNTDKKMARLLWQSTMDALFRITDSRVSTER